MWKWDWNDQHKRAHRAADKYSSRDVLNYQCWDVTVRRHRAISGGWIHNQARHHRKRQQFSETFCTNAELFSPTWNLIKKKKKKKEKRKSVLQLLRARWLHIRWALNRLWPITSSLQSSRRLAGNCMQQVDRWHLKTIRLPVVVGCWFVWI